MRNRCSIKVMCLVLGLITLYGQAFAHGPEMHGPAATDDKQMERLHAIMPMLSVAAAKLETALEQGEVAAVETEAAKIIAAVPDLKKSKPHKNVEQRNKFVKLAAKLEETVISTVKLAKKGNFAGAKAAFKKVEETCAACHATYRD